MKTDLVELFQTIRASIQPYAAMGFEAVINSDDEFKLETEKRDDKVAEQAMFFSSVNVTTDHVRFCLGTNKNATEIQQYIKPQLQAMFLNGCYEFRELKDDQLRNIELALSEGFKIYKERGWV